MPSQSPSDAELLYMLRQKIQENQSFVAALDKFIETYRQGGSMALFAKYPPPAPVLRSRGRPKEITKDMGDAIQKNFRRVDRIAKEIFKKSTVMQRESRIIKEFGRAGRQVIQSGVLTSPESLRNEILAKQTGTSIRALQDYLRDNLKTLKAKQALSSHPEIVECCIRGHGRDTRIEVTVENLTPELKKTLNRHRATIKVRANSFSPTDRADTPQNDG
jgi:hypothetical protein